MGLIAELLMRTYYESQNKAVYLISEKINIPIEINGKKGKVL
jgi:hypothetical protein